MFVKNAWYVGAWSDEIGDSGMLARTLLGEPVLFYRTADGTLAALQDRCCHRGLPLSHGRVQGDCVTCGYHGLTFNRTGACVNVPGQERIPPAAKVPSYLVRESDGMVWIWMGDASQADDALIVSHSFAGNAEWTFLKDRYLVNANYQLITDNLMDLTHVGYVHNRTIGGTPQAHSEAESKTSVTSNGVRVERWMMDSVPPPSYCAVHKFHTPRIDRWMEIDFFAPSIVRIHTGAMDTNTGAREGQRNDALLFWGFNAQTPETETTTHYFWSGARSHVPGRSIGEQRLDSLRITFAEDKEIVEAQQASLDLQPEPLVMIASDAGMMGARRRVAMMLKAEAVSWIQPVVPSKLDEVKA
jgi:phenylpropionate dioxygenase-like ring-hydroxylating dioxygenase large terminal subunit